MDWETAREHGPEFLYALLSRMMLDCEYYLGNGGRHAKHLWAGNEREQIKWMRRLYRHLCEVYAAPEWIDAKEIEDYAVLMMVE